MTESPKSSKITDQRSTTSTPNTNLLNVNGVNIYNHFNSPDSFKSSSSYGASFSENISVIGNQIQFNESSINIKPGAKKVDSTLNLSKDPMNDSLNSRFVIKFSEQDLKVILLLNLEFIKILNKRKHFNLVTKRKNGYQHIFDRKLASLLGE